MHTALMIAFHFPPLAGSSGIQRTLRFVQHLPAHGWQPVVLTVDPRAYERTSDDLLADIPANTPVHRAFALDAARHLSLGGRYFAALARPDRWMSWRLFAVAEGLKLARRHKPRVIWSTYPIATAHLIGAALHRRTGLPWIADFRDPMAQEGYPQDPKIWANFKRIEETAAQQAAVLCFTTPSAADTYRRRYPTAASRIVVLENGYDEATFARAEGSARQRLPLNPGCTTLLHSGIVYPSERDPRHLFQALGQLRASPELSRRLRIRFRAAVAEDLLRQLAVQHGVEHMIEIEPPIPYEQALAEMLQADGLLVMQASNCNEQVPAKIYEYLRARRPIVSLTDPAGDTWRVLSAAGLDAVARLDDTTAIAELLQRLVSHGFSGCLADDAAVDAASRAARSAELASVLNRLSAGSR